MLVDQELSLFHDTAPALCISDLECPLPGSEAAWSSANAEEWLHQMPSFSAAEPSRMSSLHRLLGQFAREGAELVGEEISARHLRLLLHPLQTMVFQARQVRSLLPHANPLDRSESWHQASEIQCLLRQWFDRASQLIRKTPECHTTLLGLIQYHLISLSIVSELTEIERFAQSRGKAHAGHHTGLIFDGPKTLYHCGQVFRILRLLSPERRPPWWSTAIYRVTMILWYFALTHGAAGAAIHPWSSQLAPDDLLRPLTASPSLDGDVFIDHIADESDIDRGTPALTRHDGKAMPLHDAQGMLQCGIAEIAAGLSTRMGEGLKRKLSRLAREWTVDCVWIT